MKTLVRFFIYLLIFAVFCFVLLAYFRLDQIGLIALRLTSVGCYLDPDCGFDIKDNHIITNQAVAERNPALCQSMPDHIWFSANRPRRLCFREYYMRTNDVDGCKAIYDQYCFFETAIREMNPERCHEGAAYFRLDAENLNVLTCFGRIAEARQDPTICHMNGTDPDTHALCKMRIKGATREVCQPIVDPDKTEECISYFTVFTNQVGLRGN